MRYSKIITVVFSMTCAFASVRAASTCSLNEAPELGIDAHWEEFPDAHWKWATLELKDSIAFEGQNYAIFTLWKRQKHQDIVTVCTDQGWKILAAASSSEYFVSLGVATSLLSSTEKKSLTLGGKFENIYQLHINADQTYSLVLPVRIKSTNFALYDPKKILWTNPSHWPLKILEEDGENPDDLEKSDGDFEYKIGIEPIDLYGRTFLFAMDYRAAAPNYRLSILLYDDETKEKEFWRKFPLLSATNESIRRIGISSLHGFQSFVAKDGKSIHLRGSFEIRISGQQTQSAQEVWFDGYRLRWK